jgi:hypothetical protein
MSDDFTNYVAATESYQTTVLEQNQAMLIGLFVLIGIGLFISFRLGKLS